MGMKLKSGADLCGFELTNFCIQGLESMPSDAALGRKYFHTNATDDVATGISLLHRERIYLGEGAWRATAYLDDIAGIQTKLDMILGDVDLDGVIENMNEVIKFLEDNKDTENLMTLLNNKLNKSGGTITGVLTINTSSDKSLVFDEPTGEKYHVISFAANGKEYANLSASYIGKENVLLFNDYKIIHSGNIGSYKAGGLAHSNGTVGAVVNASGNVLIGTTEGTRKLVVTTTETTNWAAQFNSPTSKMDVASGVNNGVYISINTENESNYILRCEYANKAALSVQGNGNVLIGRTTDEGDKLQVNGGIALTQHLNFGGGIVHRFNSYDAGGSFAWRVNGVTSDIMVIDASANVGIGTTNPQKKLHVVGDLYVDGNIIATKEVSAGGAGTEESTSGSGSAEGVSEIFTPTSTSMAFDHNLGEDVIVQVYEKSGNVWNMVMVDTEITSATRVTLRFGKTETTQHKVVIMGV